jgi:hypothetical protein
MSKRFTETTKWEDPWFRELTPTQKSLWAWLLDKCDCAGVLPEIDWKLASFQIGAELDAKAMQAFAGRAEPCGKGWWIRKFIAYQYGSALSCRNAAHRGVLRALKNAKLDAPVALETEGPTKDLPRTFKGPKDKDKDKDKEKDKDKLPNKTEPRKRNEALDALATVAGGDPSQVPPSAWSGAQKCLNDIKAVMPEVTADEIRRRAANYRLHYPRIAISPTAIAKHWALCDKPPQNTKDDSLFTDTPDDVFYKNAPF